MIREMILYAVGTTEYLIANEHVKISKSLSLRIVVPRIPLEFNLSQKISLLKSPLPKVLPLPYLSLSLSK